VEKCYRGGGFDTTPAFANPTYRGHDLPEKRFNFTGFRIALDAGESKYKANYHPAFITICADCGKENFFSNESCPECHSQELKPLKNENPLTSAQFEALAIDMVAVEGGSFMMGKNTRKPIRKAQHKVTLDGFSIGRTTVTQALWNQVMDHNPSRVKGDDLPVTDINWFDAEAFTRKLSYLTGKVYRLPTEAEWEFAARGGNYSLNFKYAGSNKLREVGWYRANNRYWNTKPVAGLKPNELGLYDMSGNVDEWCQDWYGEFTTEALLNPKGPETGTERVVRGGWTNSEAEYCELSLRSKKEPLWYRGLYGLRLAMCL
jgi:formylglycine-generating enzyme required for sulfatase activity